MLNILLVNDTIHGSVELSIILSERLNFLLSMNINGLVFYTLKKRIK